MMEAFAILDRVIRTGWLCFSVYGAAGNDNHAH